MCTISFEEREVTSYVPANVGLGTNPNYVEFSYCLNCGTIQGDFPIQLPITFRSTAPAPVIEKVEYVSDVLHDFYHEVMDNSNKLAADLLIRKVTKFLQPIDASILTTAWHKFEELRRIHPIMPEFDETVNWVIKKYKNVKITNNMRAY
jgi:hypothetical protein